MGSLLTFAACALPLVCAEKEFAALVLLAVSACRVVVGNGIVPVGDLGGVAVVALEDPPQEARRIERHSNPTMDKQRGETPVFTEAAPRKLGLIQAYGVERDTRMLAGGYEFLRNIIRLRGRSVNAVGEHSDMESTMRYLKPSRGQHTRDKVNEIFA
jgi:hypothetical protein